MSKVLEHYIWLRYRTVIVYNHNVYNSLSHCLPHMQTYERSLDFSLRINVSLTVIDQDNNVVTQCQAFINLTPIDNSQR